MNIAKQGINCPLGKRKKKSVLCLLFITSYTSNFTKNPSFQTLVASIFLPSQNPNFASNLCV
ncbi:hypothetical protein H5410_034457 [Solanum commersonii]|uniref:Uncharacterized protein n=1 Tax=Solanum commersonii TaxID=4109 RepID=A0A9J5YTF8_SOLCO|nr:hypothetical protein H5410_034457 [Solanum commersonii]